MKYILCSVLWADSDLAPGYAVSGIYAASVTDETNPSQSAVYKSFLPDNHDSQADMLRAFLDFCSGEFMLCLWDGFSAGRIKKIFDFNGMRHPYVHMYHLKRVSELTREKCTDLRKKKILGSILAKKPVYYEKRSSAEAEVKWLVSLFGALDFSVMEKKPAIDFIEQPSNVYFVFKNGKCFHTNKCRIVKDASVSSLRSYTYYRAVKNAGFTPCSKCKPQDIDAQTSEIMKKLNAEKQEEAKARYASGNIPKPVRKRKKTLNVYKSLSHMCDIYHLNYERKGKNVYISSGERFYMLSPEDNPVILSVKNKKNVFAPMKKEFPDPYEAVREILRINKEK